MGACRSPSGGAAVPTYDYQCTGCNATYELRESFSAPMEHTCEECGKAVAKRVLTAPRIVFKGSGWYATDSRNRSTSTTDNDAPPTSTPSSESASATKSETTPTTPATS